MIVEILSMGSCWRESSDHRPLVWNTSGVADLRGTSPRSTVRGQVRFHARLLNEAIGTTGLRNSVWHTSAVSERLGFRGLALERRAAHTSATEWFLASVTERLAGTLDDTSFDPENVQLISLSNWRGAQEALILARRTAWLRGSSAAAVFTPNAPDGDWTVRSW